MSLSLLPLSYCTNVHPGRSLAEVEAGLDRFTLPIAQKVGKPIAAGLWLARPVVDELLASPGALQGFAEGLRRRGLSCYTLNAFPYGDFHSARVKEQVYLPDWTHPNRLDYTLGCATALAALMADEVEGSISTVPLGFKGFSHPPGFLDDCAERLVDAAAALSRIHQETGKLIRLAIEPEPLCLLETTPEAIDFFRRLRHHAERRQLTAVAHEHLGLCYDVCHQAVEFEDVEESIVALDEAGIRLNKIHLSCAIELESPLNNEPGRQALLHYIEPRYLHQTLARTRRGEMVRQTDLDAALVGNPPKGFAEAASWRVHFHVPVDVHRLGPLSTTRGELIKAITEVAELSYAPHLEVETYTWEVMPGAGPADLVEGLSREIIATQKLIAEAQGR